MSDSQAYEEVTLSSDGVSVVKRFEEDEFPVPAIAFEFSSDRDEAVTVRLVDDVPDGVAVEDLGFHPEYGSEYWTIDEDEITFEREIDANSEYTTVYGIRATGTDDVEQFLTEPDLASVDPPLPDDEEVIPESDDDVVRDVISGETEDVPGLEDEEGDEPDEDIETLDLKDPNESEGAAGAATAEDTAGDADEEEDKEEDEEANASEGQDEDETETTAEGEATETDVSLEGDNLVSALAAEIRQNNVSAEDVKLLRQAFEIAGQEGGSITARLDRIQGDVSKLRAYTDAMEEFLDENGTAQQLIDDIDADVGTLEETVNSMESTVQDNASEVEGLSEQIQGMDDEVTAVREEVDEVHGDVDDVHGEVSDVHEEVDSLGGDVDDVESTVETLESSIDELESDVSDLRENVSDEDVADRIDDLEEELSDLQDWQEQIKSTFGG